MNQDKINHYREWKKQRPDYPLTVHPSGQWSKKIRGQVFYFGPLHDPDAALAQWLEEEVYLVSGLEPPSRVGHASLKGKFPQSAALEQVAQKFDALCDRLDELLRHHHRPTGGPQLYTVEEAAEKLAITKRAAQTLIRRGELSFVDVSSVPNSLRPRKRVREDDLLAFLERRRAAPIAPHTDRRRRRRPRTT